MSCDFQLETLIRANDAETSEKTKPPTRKGTKRKRSPEKNGEAKKKRVRTIYTKEHLQRLEAFFANSPYPDLLMREEIAEQLDLTEQKIHIWFQNRRAKQRRLSGQPAAVVTASGNRPRFSPTHPELLPPFPVYFPLIAPFPSVGGRSTHAMLERISYPSTSQQTHLHGEIQRILDTNLQCAHQRAPSPPFHVFLSQLRTPSPVTSLPSSLEITPPLSASRPMVQASGLSCPLNLLSSQEKNSVLMYSPLYPETASVSHRNYHLGHSQIKHSHCLF